MTEEQLPPEPGEVPDTTLGLSDDEAGHPSLEPDPTDQELGDLELDDPEEEDDV